MLCHNSTLYFFYWQYISDLSFNNSILIVSQIFCHGSECKMKILSIVQNPKIIRGIIIYIFVQEINAEDKLLLDKIIWAIELLGCWPLNRSIKQTILFLVSITYYLIHLSMSYTDLINVFGNLELMTINLMETAVQMIAIIRLVYLKLSPRVKKTIISYKENLNIERTNDSTEVQIYDYYRSVAKLYFSIIMPFSAMTSFAWYLMPLQNCLIAWLKNEPVILVPPYKVVYVFFNLTSMEQIIVAYIYQAPMSFLPLGFIGIICLKIVIIANVCSQLAVLSYRIKNLNFEDNNKKFSVFGYIVRKHWGLVRFIMEIDDTWTLIFCFELMLSTILCALVTYNAVMAIGNKDKIEIISLFTYVISSLLILFANCLMGEMLKFESENLQEALYSCDWFEMSINHKRSLLICMTRSQIPLQLTAGKCYVYSFNAYVQIVKSAMGCVSLLRTLTM
nr:olfactory receptor 126 [Microplitis mediator]